MHAIISSMVAALFLAPVSGIIWAADTPRPDALLMVDQHREAIVDRVIKAWPEPLAGEQSEALRKTLWALRADQLLAVSITPGLNGLLSVFGAADRTAEIEKVAGGAAKALGDTNADLTYTPVVPCRIADTRVAGGPLAANVARTFDGFSSDFSTQGGTASSCGMPNGVAAIAMNVYAVNPTNLGFIKVWPAGAAEPTVSTVNYQVGITAIATGTIVPVNAANQNRFTAKSPAAVDMIVDVVGYFKAPGGTVGDITSVTAGTGLSGGASSGEATLSIASSYRLPQVCATGQIPKRDISGNWACGDDATGGGSVTQVSTGAGLTGGPITTTGTVSIASGGVTAAMLASSGCTANQLLKWSGSTWFCANDNAGSGSVTQVNTGAGLTGGPITTSGTVSIASSGVTAAMLASNGCQSGQILKFNGSAWACASDDGASSPSNMLFVAKAGAQYSSIQAAIDAATGLASSQNRYLVKIAPGVYSEQVTLAYYVDLEGSGAGATVITSASTLETVIAGFDATIRDLTIQNTRSAPGGDAYAINFVQAPWTSPPSSSQLRLLRVELIASGAGTSTYCVKENYALQPIVRIVDSTCLSTGSQAYGILVRNPNADIVIDRTSVSAQGNNSAYGIWIDGKLLLDSSTILASAGSSATGILVKSTKQNVVTASSISASSTDQEGAVTGVTMGGPGRVSMSRIVASGKQRVVGLDELWFGSVVKLEIRDTSVSADGQSEPTILGGIAAIRSQSSAVAVNSSIRASGYGAVGFRSPGGAYGVPAISNSTVEAQGTGSKSVDATGYGLSVPKIAQSQIIGPMVGTIACFGNYDENLAPITTCP